MTAILFIRRISVVRLVISDASLSGRWPAHCHCVICQEMSGLPKAHVPGNLVWASANVFLQIHTLYVVTLVQADRGKLR